MVLGVRKEPGYIPGSGFHYMIHPMKLENQYQIESFRLMGHIIVEVPDNVGERLLREGCAALRHQVEIAVIAEEALKKEKEE